MEAKETAKAKSSIVMGLGMTPEGMEGKTITWVPFIQNQEDAETMSLLARKRKEKIYKAPAKALQDWLEGNRHFFKEEVRDCQRQDVEEIERQIALLQSKADKLRKIK